MIGSSPKLVSEEEGCVVTVMKAKILKDWGL